MGSSPRLGMVLRLVGGFVLGGRNAAGGGVRPPGVEPVHVVSGSQFDVSQVLHGPCFLINSVLCRPMADSIGALSRASPAVPMEASIAASIKRAMNRN